MSFDSFCDFVNALGRATKLEITELQNVSDGKAFQNMCDVSATNLRRR
jgi:hypothetical protein